jgi:proteasome lid subunit RPN8/RPN11
VISRSELARLARAARAAAPAEACGVLGASRAGAALRLHVVPLTAARTSANGFRISRSQLVQARRVLRRRGLVLCGCFHSHPTRAPDPSPLDRLAMRRAPFWWLIYSPRARSVRLVRARGEQLEPARLRVG